MRVLFIFLLVINVIFFTWQFFSSDVELPVDVVATSGQGGTLTLLSEVNAVADKNSLVNKEPVVIEELIVEEESVVVELTAPDMRADLKSGSAPDLLPPKPLSASLARSCFQLGPIVEQDDAKSLIKMLTDLGIDARQRKASREVIKGYRVHISPFAEYDQAKKKMGELKKSGVKDVALVELKKDGYLVSLGFFNFQSSAKRRVVQLQQKGYEVQLETRYKNKPVYWVDIEVDGQGDESLWRDVDAAYPKMERQKTKCL